MLACLCVVCLGGVYFFGQSQLNQISSQLGIPGNPNQAAQPTAAPGVPTSASQRNSPTTAAQPSGGSGLDALTKAFQGWGNVKSFRARISTGAAPEMTMEIITPDKIHMTGTGFEMIMIGNTSYVKAGPTWQKMNLPQSIDVNMFNPKTYQTQLQSLPDAKIIGPEVLPDGTATIAYQFGPTTQATTKVWVGVADGFPHKIESAGATIQFYDFNASNISITAPIP